MFRFSIRDLLWLTVVVALGVAWWMEHKAVAELKDELRSTLINFNLAVESTE